MQRCLWEEEIAPDLLRWLKMHSSSSQSHYQGVSGTLQLPVKHFFFLFFWGRVPFSLQLFTYLLIKSYCIQGLWKKPAYRCTWVQMGAYISRVPLERRNVADVEEARCSHITVQYCRINPFSFPFRSGTHPITFIILFKLGVHSPLIVNRKS